MPMIYRPCDFFPPEKPSNPRALIAACILAAAVCALITFLTLSGCKEVDQITQATQEGVKTIGAASAQAAAALKALADSLPQAAHGIGGEAMSYIRDCVEIIMAGVLILLGGRLRNASTRAQAVSSGLAILKTVTRTHPDYPEIKAQVGPRLLAAGPLVKKAFDAVQEHAVNGKGDAA